MKQPAIMDIECFPGYFAVGLLNVATRKVTFYEQYDDHALDIEALRQIRDRYQLITFNGRNYDMPMLTVALDGASCAKLKKISDKIIKNNITYWNLGIEVPKSDHIDIMEVAPGVRASLKLRGARMHCKVVRDLPFDPDATILPEHREVVREYCANDLLTTLELYQTVQPQIEMRVTLGDLYGIDLRSKSDAQVAESIIRSSVEKRSGHKIERREYDALAGQTFHYAPPSFLAFDNALLAEAFDIVCGADFVVAANGTVKMPTEIARLKVKVGSGTYKMGMGGLHSTETRTAWRADEDHLLIDKDVASYYPSIILKCGLAPETMGRDFTVVYKDIVQRRLAAKRRAQEIKAQIAKLKAQIAEMELVE